VHFFIDYLPDFYRVIRSLNTKRTRPPNQRPGAAPSWRLAALTPRHRWH